MCGAAGASCAEAERVGGSGAGVGSAAVSSALEGKETRRISLAGSAIGGLIRHLVGAEGRPKIGQKTCCVTKVT